MSEVQAAIDAAINLRESESCNSCRFSSLGMIAFCNHPNMPSGKQNKIWLCGVCNLYEAASEETMKDRNRRLYSGDRRTWDAEK